MCPALGGNQAQAQTSKVGVGVQDLGGVHSPHGRGIGGRDHTILLCDELVDVVDEAIGRIPAVVEDLFQSACLLSSSSCRTHEIVEECPSRESALRLVLSAGGREDGGQDECASHVE